MNQLYDLKIRAISSLVIAVIALTAVLIGGVTLYCLVIFAAIMMHKEWKHLAEEQIYALYMFGYPYVIIPCASIIWLRGIAVESDNLLGLKLVLTLIAIVSATDIGAYFTGRQFGKHKLCPAISPNKTWEGLAGGIIFAIATSLIATSFIDVAGVSSRAFLIGGVIAVIAQAGDLFKSWIKRRAGVKDSGNIIPGHGGLIDRLDGYMFNAPLFALIVYIYL